MRMTTGTSNVEDRREWLAVLAHAPREALERYAEAIGAEHFECLREPEVGLAMLRARVAKARYAMPGANPR